MAALLMVWVVLRYVYFTTIEVRDKLGDINIRTALLKAASNARNSTI